MSESFAELFEESLAGVEMRSGYLVQGVVLKIDNGHVLVDAGLKSEAVIPVEQFLENGEFKIAVGDTVEVVLDTVEDSFGETRLSREKAKRAQMWRELEEANETGATIKGMITGKVKGGFTVDLNGIRAFLPGSLVDVRPLKDTTFLEEAPIDLKLIKIDSKRNNVVVSRRAVIEQESSAEREALLESLQEGDEIQGVVKNLTDYGAFVDLGGIDGLLHITDMAWKRIHHPSEMLAVGDEIKVRVLKFEKERKRVSLGLKQLEGDPWMDVIQRYPEGKRVHGKVTNIADYGCFVEIENGIEGLVHVSEMDWTNKNVNPHKVVQLDQEVDVIVLDIDEERRRISLGLKQCIENPWESFSSQYKVGDKVSGQIKSITDFGVFLGVAGGIDGLIHLSDLSWSKPGEEAVRDYNKGDEVEALVLAIDVERGRISLGIKQLADDPVAKYSEKRNVVVKAKVSEVEEAGVHFELDEDTRGYLRASDISQERVEDARQHFKAGDEVEVMITGFDRKKNQANLSIRAISEGEEREAAKQYREQQAEALSSTTIGDLIKEKMDKVADDGKA